MAKMSWKGINVFVTGADGFIGSHVAKVLAEKSAEVVTIVRDVKKKSNLDVLGIKDKITVINGGLVNFHDCERIMNEYEIEFCFHLAAKATGISWRRAGHQKHSRDWWLHLRTRLMASRKNCRIQKKALCMDITLMMLQKHALKYWQDAIS